MRTNICMCQCERMQIACTALASAAGEAYVRPHIREYMYERAAGQQTVIREIY